VFKSPTPETNMKYINILKSTLSSVLLLGVNSAVAQGLTPTLSTGQSYDSIVQGTNWQTEIDDYAYTSLIHSVYTGPGASGPDGPDGPDEPINLVPGALLYASDELYDIINNLDISNLSGGSAYTPQNRNIEADLTSIDVLTIGTESPEGSPPAEMLSIEAPTMVNNILASEALTTNIILSDASLTNQAIIGNLAVAELILFSPVPDEAGLGLSARGMNGLITRDFDGTIHLGTNSFIFDDVSTNHILTTDSGTEIILGGDIASTTGDDESKDIRVANDLYVDGDIFIDGNPGVQAQLDILNQSSSANFANAIASNSTAIASNKRSIEQNARGIAMVAALQHTTVLPGMSHALDVSAAHFEGETGMSLNYARRINENVQINFGAASTDDFDESVIKAGIGVQW
jgi:hypothetical protein